MFFINHNSAISLYLLIKDYVWSDDLPLHLQVFNISYNNIRIVSLNYYCWCIGKLNNTKGNAAWCYMTYLDIGLLGYIHFFNYYYWDADKNALFSPLFFFLKRIRQICLLNYFFAYHNLHWRRPCRIRWSIVIDLPIFWFIRLTRYDNFFSYKISQ